MEAKYEIEDLLLMFKKAQNKHENLIRKVTDKYDISLSEAFVLLFINNNPNMNRSCDIVTNRGFSKAYVSKAIDSLIKKNYISLKVNETDRRYQHIIINDGAKNIIKELEKIHNENKEKMKENISEEELQIFFKVINKMLDNMERDVKDV